MKTKEDIRNSLTISAATVANWVKTGIIPDYRTDDKMYSDMEYDEIIFKVSESGKLKTRANRFHSTDSRQELNTLQSPKSKILLKALFEIVKINATDIATAMLALSLRTLEQAGLIEAKLSKTKNQYSISITSGNKQFSNFLKSWYSEVSHEKFFSFYQSIDQFDLITDEPDFLGAFYESMRNLGEKSKLGAFFTPSFLVKDLVIPIDASVLDPCSGTGTILLSIIDKNHSPSKITLRDIDELALRLAKVNFVLFFKRTDILINTVCSDAILWSDKKKFEYIITNPPWGAFKDPDCMASVIKKNPAWRTLDSFSIILSQAIDNLSKKSKLVFILPESFLYVDAYQAVREKIFEKKAGITVTFFGNAFRGVQSKVIRLEADFSKDRKFFTQNKSEVIEFSEDLLRKNDFRPPAIRSKAELQILKKILKSNHFTLKGKCIFGLGIVTGNNKKHLQDTHKKGFEPIYTGKELNAFDFSAATSFIDFNPRNIQQSAPENLYRSPKICYRFISNKLQMTADFEGKLILNSVNFFIPPDGIALKALAAFLNSPLCSFLYQRLFNSVKVLKAHLEKLPIPYTFYDCEEKLTLIYDKASLGLEYRNELHQLTLEMFGLPSDVVFDI
jgi:predicted RNA methylase